ncbi:DUF2927 domain-containing protein [Thalassospiraceae bacterium LMO-JJ14]|nr:DUF2927 domain-containing protein [Thalassospiraceae bacterium LMO-JJ14]
MMKRILFVLSLLLSAVPSHADEDFSNADLLRNFDVIAFGNEYTGKKYDIVRKWAKPMLMGIQGKNYPAHLEAFIDDVAHDLNQLTGHRIELYYSFAKQKAKQLPADFDRNNVNVILYYMSDEEIPAALAKYWKGDQEKVRWMVQNSTCFANYFTRKGEIVAAVIVFPSRHPESYLRACAVEEITQILGLPNDSNAVKPSIFNDSSRYFELTEHDRWLLRALYQKDITPGMSRNETLTRVLAFLKRARPE